MATEGEFDESFFETPSAGDHESDHGGSAAGSSPSTSVLSKRKRKHTTSPGAVNDEDEVARRRRRRQSLAFAQRRKSLTLNSSGSKQKGTADDAAATSSSATTTTTTATVTGAVSRTTSFRTAGAGGGNSSRQYISDMYSTIIKMSSENKINVKNSWSLHLIDHMEDILGSSRKEDEEDADDTYNFQKASCTLDASIKIYSYRVDDTWNSSYKILENLSRTDDTNKQHGTNSDSDDDDNDRNEPKAARKASRKAHTAARTIEKNLNNINLKSFELEFEADPLFHKMSQSFDEGGAKGMLLANLGLYDGCKILLNSSDVSVATRKPLESVPSAVKSDKNNAQATADNAAADATIKTEDAASVETVAPPASAPKAPAAATASKRISLASFGTLACFTEDVLAFEVCPPLSRLYEQLDEYYGDDAPQLKVKTTSEHLIKTPVKPPRLSIESTTAATPVRARLDFDAFDDVANTMTMAAIAEVDEDVAAADGDATDAVDPSGDVAMEEAETANDFEFGDNDAFDENDDTAAHDATNDIDALGDASQRDDEHAVVASQFDGDSGSSPQDDARDTLDVNANAADFFRTRAQHSSASPTAASAQDHDGAAYTMQIENALLRSAAAGNGVDDSSNASDYSYFDVKMLRNWAGPTHWKFPAVRKVQSKALATAHDTTADSSAASNELALMEASDDDESNASGTTKNAKTKAKKAAAAASADTHRSVVIDFFAADEPDCKAAFKPARTASLITTSKIMAKRQGEKAAELVFPVDSHVDLKVFFQHFMKPKLRFFKKPAGQALEPNDVVSNALDASTIPSRSESASNVFSATSNSLHIDRNDARDNDDDDDNIGAYDFDGGDSLANDDMDDNDNRISSTQDDALYSTEGLISANRVIERIDVHYERFAKRVDVKKLKHNIWDHLENETTLLVPGLDSAGNATAQATAAAAVDAQTTSMSDSTTFESVVQSVSDRVPPDVTVSFYFICMLHLANEKGLELQGQDDLRNFTIRKEADDL